MKFFWYVKALHIIHESEMTKIMPSRISPGLSDTTHRAKWSVNIVSCRLFFVKTVYRQPNADWLLFLVCFSEDCTQTVKWRVTSPSFQFFSVKTVQRTRWRISTDFCLFFSVKTVHRPSNGEWRKFSVFLNEDRTQTGNGRVAPVSCLLFLVKTVQGLSRAAWLLLHTCCSSYRLAHRQPNTE